MSRFLVVRYFYLTSFVLLCTISSLFNFQGSFSRSASKPPLWRCLSIISLFFSFVNTFFKKIFENFILVVLHKSYINTNYQNVNYKHSFAFLPLKNQNNLLICYFKILFLLHSISFYDIILLSKSKLKNRRNGDIL